MIDTTTPSLFTPATRARTWRVVLVDGSERVVEAAAIRCEDGALVLVMPAGLVSAYAAGVWRTCEPGANAMTRRWCIRLSCPDRRDHARAAIGILPRHTIVVFISKTMLVGVVVVAVVLLGLVAAGLARAADAQESAKTVENSGFCYPIPLGGGGSIFRGRLGRDRAGSHAQIFSSGRDFQNR